MLFKCGHMEVFKNRGPPFGSPYDEHHSILGSILGPLIDGKLNTGSQQDVPVTPRAHGQELCVGKTSSFNEQLPGSCGPVQSRTRTDTRRPGSTRTHCSPT